MLMKSSALLIGTILILGLLSVSYGQDVEESHEVDRVGQDELKALLDLLTYYAENSESREDTNMDRRSIFLPRIGTEKRASIFLPRIGSQKRAFHMPRVGRSYYNYIKKAVHMPRIGK